MMVIGETA